MESPALFNNKDKFCIAEALDALDNSIPVPGHSALEFNDRDMFYIWEKLSTFPSTVPGRLFANALFVDAQFGLDAGAVPFSLVQSAANPVSHKYKTIIAARAAANPGDVIIVYPGTYDEAFANLYKNGVTYYFYPGATVKATFVPDTVNHFCAIYGNANFIGDTFFLNATIIGAKFFIQCNDINAKMNTLTIRDGIGQVYAHDISADDEAAVEVTDSNAISDGTNNIYVFCNIMTANGNTNGFGAVINNGTSGPGYDGYLKIKGNRLIGSPNSSSPAIHLDNFVVPNNRTTFDIEFPSIESSALGATPVVVIEFQNNTVVNITGNINQPLINRAGISFTGGNAGSILNWKGNITTGLADAVLVVGSQTVVNLDGSFSSSNTQTIEITSAVCTVTVNGAVFNLVGNPGIRKTLPFSGGASLIIDECKIITSVAAAIICPALDQIKVIHSLAVNFDTSPTIAAINMITGSIAYVDVNVE